VEKLARLTEFSPPTPLREIVRRTAMWPASVGSR